MSWARSKIQATLTNYNESGSKENNLEKSKNVQDKDISSKEENVYEEMMQDEEGKDELEQAIGHMTGYIATDMEATDNEH